MRPCHGGVGVGVFVADGVADLVPPPDADAHADTDREREPDPDRVPRALTDGLADGVCGSQPPMSAAKTTHSSCKPRGKRPPRIVLLAEIARSFRAPLA